MITSGLIWIPNGLPAPSWMPGTTTIRAGDKVAGMAFVEPDRDLARVEGTYDAVEHVLCVEGGPEGTTARFPDLSPRRGQDNCVQLWHSRPEPTSNWDAFRQAARQQLQCTIVTYFVAGIDYYFGVPDAKAGAGTGGLREQLDFSYSDGHTPWTQTGYLHAEDPGLTGLYLVHQCTPYNLHLGELLQGTTQTLVQGITGPIQDTDLQSFFRQLQTPGQRPALYLYARAYVQVAQSNVDITDITSASSLPPRFRTAQADQLIGVSRLDPPWKA